MCNKTILENGETLKSVPDCYKNPHDNYPHALEFKPEYYMTQNMCEKAVDTHPYTIKFTPECYKTQEMCDKAVNRYFLVFDSVPVRYKT